MGRKINCGLRASGIATHSQKGQLGVYDGSCTSAHTHCVRFRRQVHSHGTVLGHALQFTHTSSGLRDRFIHSPLCWVIQFSLHPLCQVWETGSFTYMPLCQVWDRLIHSFTFHTLKPSSTHTLHSTPCRAHCPPLPSPLTYITASQKATLALTDSIQPTNPLLHQQATAPHA